MSNVAPATARLPRIVSVVVPLRNAAATLDAQLDGLAEQTYGDRWELVIANNGSTDGSRERAAARLAEFPSARLVDASGRRGAGHARNVGAAAASGNLLLFCDADDVPSPGWIAAMVEAAASADVVAGRLETERLNDAGSRTGHTPPPTDRPIRGHAFLPFASGGNCGAWRDVFDALGGFDEDRLSGEDIDFSWRAQLAGYRLGYAAEAVIHWRLRSELRDAARQHFRWGQSYPALFRKYRSKGMPRTAAREVAHSWGLILLCWPILAVSRGGRIRWVRTAAERAGQVSGSLTHRVLFL